MSMDEAAEAVGYVYERTAARDLRVLGTCFVASRPQEGSPDKRDFFLITAEHVVHGHTDTVVILCSSREAPTAIPISEWRLHPEADVAATPIDEAVLVHVGANDIPFSLFEGFGDGRPSVLGDAILFFGLLPNLEVMGHTAVPVLRSGVVARLNQRNIRMQTTGQSRLLDGHLIDCLAYGGMSGGPCFYRYDDKWPSPTGGVVLGTRDVLLGLISGHFDEPEGASDADERGMERRGKVNAGIAVVTPAAMIADLLTAR